MLRSLQVPDQASVAHCFALPDAQLALDTASVAITETQSPKPRMMRGLNTLRRLSPLAVRAVACAETRLFQLRNDANEWGRDRGHLVVGGGVLLGRAHVHRTHPY